MKGPHIILLIALITTVIGGLFYYNLERMGHYQEQAAEMMKSRFLKRLHEEPEVKESRWKIEDFKSGSVTYSGSLPLDPAAWEFAINGDFLQILIHNDLDVPTEIQASLGQKVSETLTRLLKLKKAEGEESKIRVSFSKSSR